MNARHEPTPPQHMDWVAFDREGNAFAIGVKAPDVWREFRTFRRTDRVEARTVDEACRLHRAYLATLPNFAALLPTPTDAGETKT